MEVFSEEDKAYQLSIILATVSPIILIICTILQFLTYQLYNNRFHPFIDLVKDLKIDTTEGDSDEQTNHEEAFEEKPMDDMEDSHSFASINQGLEVPEGDNIDLQIIKVETVQDENELYT